MTDIQQAVLYDRTGGPEVLYLARVPVPTPAGREVVVDVRAVGLNPFDAKVRSGLIALDEPFPRGLGTDLAGVVVEVGADATYANGDPVRPGDEVLGWGSPTLQQRVSLPSGHLTRKPSEVSFAVAGSLSTPGQTAVASLDTVPIGRDDTVLVGAAAGAVGFLYCQLARRAGARVIGTASPRNHERLRAIGVMPVAYGPGLVDRVQAAAPDGVTVAQDNAGRETVMTALGLGVPAERINTIVDYAAVAEFGIRTPGRYERRTDVLADLVDLVAKGELILPVHREFSLADVGEAFSLMEAGHLCGKVVVAP